MKREMTLAPKKIETLINRPLPSGIVADTPSVPKVEPTHQPTETIKAVTTPAADGWYRQKMPSGNVVYDDVLLKTLDVSTLKKVSAAISAKDFTLLLDALDSRISMDIRDLTVPDFYFFMYWQRLNSYPRSPHMVPWTSKYGNKNITRVTMTDLTIKELQMTKATLEAWRQKGIDIPRIRDMEVLADTELSAEDRWELEYAQYMYIPDVTETILQDKRDKLAEIGPEALVLVDEFSDLIIHGVEESVTVRDDKFEMDPAIDFLKEEIDQLTIVANTILEDDDPKSIGAANGILTHIANRKATLDAILKAKETNTVYVPESEVVAIGTADATILFPKSASGI